MKTMLYPRNTVSRRALDLNGLWKIYFDFEGDGRKRGLQNGIPGKEMIPVPASFADFYTDKELRDFCGDIWYETSFFVPGELQGSIVELRFGAVAHRAEVYVNGEKRGFHEGGFVPFCVDVTDCVRYQEENRLVVLVNNELSDTSLPAGETEILKNGRKKAVPYFDFFNYSGIIRPVWLMSTPRHRICDYSVRHEISGKDACTWYQVEIENPEPDLRMEVRLWDEEGKLAAYSEGMDGRKACHCRRSSLGGQERLPVSAGASPFSKGSAFG